MRCMGLAMEMAPGRRRSRLIDIIAKGLRLSLINIHEVYDGI
jgi:hypothetical protein